MAKAGGAALAKLAGRAGEDVEAAASHEVSGAACGLSFAASTLVSTPTGKQSIASLKVGDKVLAVDPKTGKTTTQTVQQVFLNHDTDLLNVTLRTVAKAAPHATTAPAVDPAYKQRMAAVASHGSHAPPATAATTSAKAEAASSTAAAQPGDETIHTTANHPWLSADRGWVVAGKLQLGERVRQADGSTAEVVALTTVRGTAPMWDLTVSQVHDFAVGNGAFVVHNCNFGSNKSKIDWNEIESGHTEGGSRVSSRKTLFNGASRKEVRGIVKQAWRNRVKAGGQQIDLVTGEVRQRWMGTAGKWKVTGVYNHTTDTVESAWPTFEHHLSFTRGFFRGR